MKHAKNGMTFFDREDREFTEAWNCLKAAGKWLHEWMYMHSYPTEQGGKITWNNHFKNCDTREYIVIPSPRYTV